MTNTAREFRTEDWYGFAGCSKFADGSLPLIRDINSTTLAVADAHGIMVSIYDEDRDLNNDYAWFVDWPSQTVARIMIDGLRDDLNDLHLIEARFDRLH